MRQKGWTRIAQLRVTCKPGAPGGPGGVLSDSNMILIYSDATCNDHCNTSQAKGIQRDPKGKFKPRHVEIKRNTKFNHGGPRLSFSGAC